MSEADKGPHPGAHGRRKDGRPYKDGNTREDGSYTVGKYRTPKETRFRVDDGRPRGRRKKGVRNVDTDFERELNRKISIKEDGNERRVSKSRAVDMRLIDNAARKGDNRAIELVDQRRRRIAAEKEESARRYHTLTDHEILRQFIRERAEELQVDPELLGDPEPQSDPETDGG